MANLTDEQKSLIESYSCERLSSNPKNQELIKQFECQKGSSLVSYLQKFAWDEDLECKTAYYLIKSSDNEIALFFSLKCGALFDPLDEKNMQQRVKEAKELLQIIRKISSDGKEQECAYHILEQFRSGQDVSIDQIKNELKLSVQQTKKILEQLNVDRQREGNEQIIRVSSTYPAIELVHFCVNDLIKDKWKAHGIKRPIGEVMFWMYIAPLIYETQNRIGCQYAFLFAADTSEDRNLVNYYNIALKFNQPMEIGTNKPRYDLCCEFMCQEIKELKAYRKEYFENFNPNSDDIIA